MKPEMQIVAPVIFPFGIYCSYKYLQGISIVEH